MKNLSLLLVLSIIIISCSSPLDKAYKQDTLEEDIVALKESISEEELNTLAGYIALKTLSADDMLGKTYNELLNEAKKMKEELKIQEEEVVSIIKYLSETLNKYQYCSRRSVEFGFEVEVERDIYFKSNGARMDVVETTLLEGVSSNKTILALSEISRMLFSDCERSININKDKESSAYDIMMQQRDLCRCLTINNRSDWSVKSVLASGKLMMITNRNGHITPELVIKFDPKIFDEEKKILESLNRLRIIWAGENANCMQYKELEARGKPAKYFLHPNSYSTKYNIDCE